LFFLIKYTPSPDLWICDKYLKSCFSNVWNNYLQFIDYSHSLFHCR